MCVCMCVSVCVYVSVCYSVDQINWRDFLPDNFDTYKIAFSFQTVGGYYSDGVFATLAPNLGTLDICV